MAPMDIETFGEPYGWRRGSGDWQGVRAAFDQQAAIQVIQEAGSTDWQTKLPLHHAFYFGFPDFPPQPDDPPPPQARIWISPIQRTFAAKSNFPKVQWHPRVLWVGVGYQHDGFGQLETSIHKVCRSFHLAEAAIAGIATIDRKATTLELAQLCRHQNWGLRYFSAEQLNQALVSTPSAKVKTKVGAASVSEAAALLAASELSSARLRVYKQIIRCPERTGAVTIAIAESQREFDQATVEK